MTVELVERPDLPAQESDEEEMATIEHGAIGVALSSFLFAHVRQTRSGRVFDAQTTFKFLGKNPNRQPDVAYVSAARLPKDWRKEADFAPDMVAEVTSKNDKNDKDFEVEAKVLQYQRSGVRLIWILHSYSQTVEVFRLNMGLRSQRLAGDDELDGNDVIPGFKLKISELFEGVPIAQDEASNLPGEYSQ